jgi:hypothetical protein
MKIEVDLRKRYFFGVLGVILIVIGIIGVFAAITDLKPNPGHSSSELAGFPDCGANQALTQNGGAWSCVSLSTGVQSSNYLVDNFVNPEFSSFGALGNIDSGLAWSSGGNVEFFDDNTVPGTVKVEKSSHIKFEGYGQAKSEKIDVKQPFDIEFKVMIPNSASLSSNRPIRLADKSSGPSNYVGIADNPSNTDVWATRIKASGQSETSIDLTPKVKGVWAIFRIKGDGSTIRYYEKTGAAISVSSASVPSTTLDFYVGQLSSSGTADLLVDYVKIETPWTKNVVSGIVG